MSAPQFRTFAHRIAHARATAHLSQQALAKRSGVSQSQISGIESGKYDGSASTASIAEATGFNALWLECGRGRPQPEALSARIFKKTPLQHGRKRRGEALMVPRYRLEAAMGSSLKHHDHDTIAGELPLSHHWVTQTLQGITDRNNLVLITGSGDSMKPTLYDGDLLLIDRGVKSVTVNAIYLLSLNGHLHIKRLKINPLTGTLRMQSDNKKLDDPIVIEKGRDYDFQVLGQVVWSWHGERQT